MYGTPLVIGCDGLIGRALFDYLKVRDPCVIGTTRRPGSPHRNLNLEGDYSQLSFPESVRVAYLCAGITRVNACEDDPVRTRHINVKQTQMLIDKLLEQDIHVVFLSSDLAATSRCEYGTQKLTLEKYLQGKNATIVRLGKIVSAQKGRLTDWVRELEAGRPIESYNDYYFSPISIENVLAILGDEEILGTHSKILIGGTEALTYFDAIDFIAEKRGLDRSLITSTSSNIPSVEASLPDVDLKEYCFSSKDTLADIFI